MRHPARTVLAAFAALWLGAAGAGLPASAAEPAVDTQRAAEPAPSTAARLAAWITASGDNEAMPFVIVDKPGASVQVFDAGGRLVGAAPALLGLAVGDDSAPGIGKRKLSAIRPEQRTTPAGRFIGRLGPAKGEGQVLWVDYGAAISLHPVVTANPKERRLQRLRSLSPEDHRISYGCINVPAKFYRDVVRKTFMGTHGVVYVLPDTRPVEEVFPTFGLQARTSAEQFGPASAQY
jgi:hypothetical protein